MVNAVAMTFRDQNLEKKTGTNQTTGLFLQKRIADLQRDIREHEEQLVNYAKSHQMLTLDKEQNTVVDRLAGINKQLLEAENDRKTAESTLNAAKAPGAATALVSDGDPKQTSEAEGKLNELKKDRAKLLVDATEEAPEVKEINQQIAELEKQLKESKTNKATNLITNFETRYRQAAKEACARLSNKQKPNADQNEAVIPIIIQQETRPTRFADQLAQQAKSNKSRWPRCEQHFRSGLCLAPEGHRPESHPRRDDGLHAFAGAGYRVGSLPRISR